MCGAAAIRRDVWTPLILAKQPVFRSEAALPLTTEQITAAEACGIRFLPATAAQVHRLAMQRKVFHIAGQPVLATRGGGFYETASTLQRLIEDGCRQQRELPAQKDAAAPSPMAEPPPPSASEPPGPAAVPQQAAAAPPAGPSVRARIRRGERWRTAGATRRGRADRHWSVRQP